MNKRLILTLALAFLLGCWPALADEGFPSQGAPDLSATLVRPLEPKLPGALPGRLPLSRQPGSSAAVAAAAPTPAFIPLRC